MTPSMFRKWQKEMRKYGVWLDRLSERLTLLATKKNDWLVYDDSEIIEACREVILRHGRGE